jgi:hypothetical protein
MEYEVLSLSVSLSVRVTSLSRDFSSDLSS